MYSIYKRLTVSKCLWTRTGGTTLRSSNRVRRQVCGKWYLYTRREATQARQWQGNTKEEPRSLRIHIAARKLSRTLSEPRSIPHSLRKTRKTCAQQRTNQVAKSIKHKKATLDIEVIIKIYESSAVDIEVAVIEKVGKSSEYTVAAPQ